MIAGTQKPLWVGHFGTLLGHFETPPPTSGAIAAAEVYDPVREVQMKIESRTGRYFKPTNSLEALFAGHLPQDQ